MDKNTRLAQTMTDGELYRFAWAAVRTSIEHVMEMKKPDKAEIEKLRDQEEELKGLMEKSFKKEGRQAHGQ